MPVYSFDCNLHRYYSLTSAQKDTAVGLTIASDPNCTMSVLALKVLLC
jgi:hypothetical protein